MSYSEYKIEDFRLHILRSNEYIPNELHLYWNEILIYIEKSKDELDYNNIWRGPHDLVKKLLKVNRDTRVTCRYLYGQHAPDTRANYRYE